MSTYGISRDPNYYPNPDQFHPFRFYDLRAAAESSELGAEKGFGSASNLQLTSTSVTSLPWGYGKAACPGRFFASAHMKLWVAMLIQRYDFQFSKGIKRRPENIFVDERTWPSMDVELEFRKR
jgi:cytochrome P450